MAEELDSRESVDLLRDVASWTTFPPAAGVIRFWSARSKMVATGRFRVILSYGPGEKYTMAWAIDAYRLLGIPVVPRALRTEEATYDPATREAALNHGRRIIAGSAHTFPFWAGDALLEVSYLSSPTGRAAEPGATPSLILLSIPFEPVADRTLAGAEKQAVLQALEPIGFRDEVRTALIFVLENDEEELELSRNDITTRDVVPLARAYWMMPTWTQRVGVAYLLQDHGATTEVLDVWTDVLGAPDRGPDSVRHIVKAAALAWLRGDVASMDRYLDDHELVRTHARILSQLVGTARPQSGGAPNDEGYWFATHGRPS